MREITCIGPVPLEDSECARRGKGAHSIQEGQEEAVRARVELQSTLQNGDLLLCNASLHATPAPPCPIHHRNSCLEKVSANVVQVRLPSERKTDILCYLAIITGAS